MLLTRADRKLGNLCETHRLIYAPNRAQKNGERLCRVMPKEKSLRNVGNNALFFVVYGVGKRNQI